MNKLAILFLISMSAFSVNAAENFRQVVLPKSVSVHLPKNWIILSDDIMTTIDASAQSISQKMGRVDASTELAFGAGYIFGRQSAALFNIRYYPDLKVSQSMVRGFSGEEIDGRRAVEIGLGTELSDRSIEDALELARGIAQRSPDAVRAAKKVLNESALVPLSQGLSNEMAA